MYSLPCSSSEVMLLRYSAESRLSHTCTLRKFMGDLNFMRNERDLMGTKWDVWPNVACIPLALGFQWSMRCVFFRKIMKNPELLPQPPLFAPRAVVARSSAAWGLGNGGRYPPFQPFVLLATLAMPWVVWRQPGLHIIIKNKYIKVGWHMDMAYWPSKRPSKVTKPKFQLIRNWKRPTFIDVHIQSYLYSTCLIYILQYYMLLNHPTNLDIKGLEELSANSSTNIAVWACDSSWGSLFYHWIIQPTIVICWWFMIGNLAINGAPQKPMIYHHFPIVNGYTGGYIPFSDTPMGITVWSQFNYHCNSWTVYEIRFKHLQFSFCLPGLLVTPCSLRSL